MTILHVLAATAEAGSHDAGFTPYIIAAVAAGLFVALAVVTHSFRDVAHRTPRRSQRSTQSAPGHH